MVNLKGKEFVKEYPYIVLYRDTKTGLLVSYQKKEITVIKLKKKSGKKKWED